MSKTILIGADIVPTKSNFELFRRGNKDELIGKALSGLLDNADYRIFNLEVPLTDEWNPINKCGPNLIAPTDTIKGLKAINPDFFTLANNHILDQGQRGLNCTIKVLDDAGIAHAGAGINIQEARKAYVADIDGIKIGIYCCAEHEFSIATEYSAGANPYDPLESFDHVRNQRNQCDVLIVLFHGGKEEYRYPSPYLQRIFHKFADCGADYVIAQHTHCIGCKENYNGSVLIYGQGNFLFDYSDSEFWKTSLLLQIDISDEKRHSIKYIPIQKERNRVKIADENDTKQIQEGFEQRSAEILEDGVVSKKFDDFVMSIQNSYWSKLSGHTGQMYIVRIINKLLGYRLWDYLYSDKFSAPIENCLDCEAHREALLWILRKKRGKYNE